MPLPKLYKTLILYNLKHIAIFFCKHLFLSALLIEECRNTPCFSYGKFQIYDDYLEVGKFAHFYFRQKDIHLFTKNFHGQDSHLLFLCSWTTASPLGKLFLFLLWTR